MRDTDNQGGGLNDKAFAPATNEPLGGTGGSVDGSLANAAGVGGTADLTLGDAVGASVGLDLGSGLPADKGDLGGGGSGPGS